MKNEYHLDGFDINYEDKLDDSFVRVMGQVIRVMGQGCFNQTHRIPFTIAPFNQTSKYYESLYQNNHEYIRFINYQAYADLEKLSKSNPVTDTDLSKYKNLYAKLKNSYACDYGTLGLGINSNTQNPRGLQPPDIFKVWNFLHRKGVQCAMIWSLEDSELNGFKIEKRIQGLP